MGGMFGGGSLVKFEEKGDEDCYKLLFKGIRITGIYM